MGARRRRQGARRSRRFYAELADGLIAHCEHAFKLDKPKKDGTTQRKHLLAIEERGIPQPDLEGPPCPAGLAYLLLYFGEIASRRTSGPNGPNPITWGDMQAWQSLTGRTIDPFDASLLCRIDNAYLKLMLADE